jgi:hypothetical protein
MTEEVKAPEAKEVVKPPEVSKETITVDLDGVSVEVPLDTGKKLIEARQKNKKDFKELADKVAQAEASAAAEAQRASLLKSMKEMDIEAVKTQVAEEYTKKIAQYENKIFHGEVKSQLASLGVLPEALADATTLALQGAKVTLDGEIVKVNDKDAKDYLSEWVKTKSHLVAVKAPEGKKLVKPGKPPEQKPSGAERLAKGLGSFLKP